MEDVNRMLRVVAAETDAQLARAPLWLYVAACRETAVLRITPDVRRDLALMNGAALFGTGNDAITVDALFVRDVVDSAHNLLAAADSAAEGAAAGPALALRAFDIGPFSPPVPDGDLEAAQAAAIMLESPVGTFSATLSHCARGTFQELRVRRSVSWEPVVVLGPFAGLEAAQNYYALWRTDGTTLFPLNDLELAHPRGLAPDYEMFIPEDKEE